MSKTEERNSVQTVASKDGIGSQERDIILIHAMKFTEPNLTYLYNTCLPNDAEIKAHDLKEEGYAVFIVTGKMRYI